MIVILRILGVIAAVTGIVSITSFLDTGVSSTGIGPIFGLIAWNGGMAFLWFFLAHKLSARRKRQIYDALMAPCTQCGSSAAEGYRICGSCGRVKNPVLL